MIIRVPYGGGIGGVEHHSDSSEAYYRPRRGCTSSRPRPSRTPYGLLRAAIASDDPVVFLEPKRLYWSKDELDPRRAGGRRADRARAVVRRPGRSATLITYGPVAADRAGGRRGRAGRGLDLEVVDLRSLVPFDDETVTRFGARHRAARWSSTRSPASAASGAEIAARVTGALLPPPGGAGAAGGGVRHPVSAADAGASPPAGRGPDPRTPWGACSGRPRADGTSTGAASSLPDLGEGLTEAEIVRWLVEVGDVVAVDQLVVEVETAKAMVEVPCPYGGRGHRPLRRGGHGAVRRGRHRSPWRGDAAPSAGAGARHVGRHRHRLARVTGRRGARRGAEGGGPGNVLVGYGTSEAPARRRRVRADRQGAATGAVRAGQRPGPRAEPVGRARSRSSPRWCAGWPGSTTSDLREPDRFGAGRADPAGGRGVRACALPRRAADGGPGGRDGPGVDAASPALPASPPADAPDGTRVPLKGVRGQLSPTSSPAAGARSRTRPAGWTPTRPS